MNEPNYIYPEITLDKILYCQVALSNDIFEGKGIRIRFSADEDHQIAIIRFQGKLFAMQNICPHRHADQIHNGLIDKRKATVTCPLHGWTYKLEDGKNVNTLQGLKSLQVYKVFEKDGEVFVEKPELIIPKWRKSEEF